MVHTQIGDWLFTCDNEKIPEGLVTIRWVGEGLAVSRLTIPGHILCQFAARRCSFVDEEYIPF